LGSSGCEDVHTCEYNSIRTGTSVHLHRHLSGEKTISERDGKGFPFFNHTERGRGEKRRVKSGRVESHFRQGTNDIRNGGVRDLQVEGGGKEKKIDRGIKTPGGTGHFKQENSSPLVDGSTFEKTGVMERMMGEGQF